MFFEYKEESKKQISEYVVSDENHIKIDTYQWSKLNEHYSKSEIKEYLSSVIKKMSFPKRVYFESDVLKDWKSLLHSTLQYNIGSWSAPRQLVDLKLEYLGKEIYFSPTTKGLKVSNQFTQLMRMECGYHSGNSPMYEWNYPDKKNSFLRCLFGILKEDISRRGVDNSTLYQALKMHTYMASQFKPESALALYRFFNAKNVLDFSMGWGDRLVGFLASDAESYIGIDPNTKLHEPYKQIVDFCNIDKKTRFICSPAEDADLTDVKVDFVFTSPPYFDIERYSDEETQSWKRYSKTDDWLKGFLFPTLKKCWDCLEEGGRICVNIADKKGVDICTQMLNFMRDLGATYEGTIGYKMSKRNGIDLGETFCEPIWIWSKGEAKEPNWNQHLFF